MTTMADFAFAARADRNSGHSVASTTAAGTFGIRVPGDSARLVAALIGYAPETLTVTAEHHQAVTFRLAQAALALDP